MQNNKILGRMLAAVSTAVVFVASAQAALLGRDINGLAVAGSDASSVFLYDTDLNITWLRNANVDSLMTLGQANDWATGYSLGAYSGPHRQAVQLTAGYPRRWRILGSRGPA